MNTLALVLSIMIPFAPPIMVQMPTKDSPTRSCEDQLRELTRQNAAIAEELRALKETPRAKNGGGYQKTKWGMDPSDVKRLYPSARPDADGNFLVEDMIADLRAAVGFIFAKGKLVRVAVVFMVDHTNANIYIGDYEKLKAAVSEKYGQPRVDDVDWSNSMFRDKEENWGVALQYGHVSFKARWTTETTEIVEACTGDNFKVHLILAYQSKDLAGLLQDAEKAETLDKL
jgi:hypothetical protein